MTDAIKIVLPLPPSANRIWRHQGGFHHKATEYTAWLRIAGVQARQQSGGQRLPGNYAMRAVLPRTRVDLDNRCKPINDLLQLAGIVTNDSRLRSMTVEVDHDHPAECITVSVWPLPDDPKAKRKTKKLRPALPALGLHP